jgi:sugar/nucleoside kinase (ribokinase family)
MVLVGHPLLNEETRLSYLTHHGGVIQLGTKARLLIAGLSTLDVFLRGARLPDIDDHAYLHEYALLPGGSAANMGYWVAQLSVQPILCTRVGNDFAGRFIHDFLATQKVKLQPILIDPELPTGFSIINIGQNGGIGLLHSEGANNRLRASDIPFSTLKKGDTLHIAGAMSMAQLDGEPLQHLLRRARNIGINTSLHTSRNTDKKNLLTDCLRYLDIIVTNHKEALEISGCTNPESAARWFQHQGVREVAITLGKDGAYVSDGGFCGRVPAFQVSAVDTTGCGDAFTAAFVAGWEMRSIRERAIVGNALGALCAMAVGAMPPFDKRRLQALLKAGRVPGHLHRSSGELLLANPKSTRRIGL